MLKKILIKAQKNVFSKTIGSNVTKLKGDGYNFTELREYSSGDDIRHIDWIISSKLSKPYVKLFTQERELNIVIAPFISASLLFGTKHLKKDLQSEICALLSYSCLQQNNPFESYLCAHEVFIGTLRSKKSDAVSDFISKVDSFDLIGKELNYRVVLQGIYEYVKRPSMIFMIGDFFDTQNLNLSALNTKHEIILIIVRDRFEENPEVLGSVNILDLTLQKSASVLFDTKNIQEYKQALHDQDTDFENTLKEMGVKFVKIYTDEDPSEKIISLMSR